MTKGDFFEKMLKEIEDTKLFSYAVQINDTFRVIQSASGYWYSCEVSDGKGKISIEESCVVPTKKEALIAFYLTKD